MFRPFDSSAPYDADPLYAALPMDAGTRGLFFGNFKRLYEGAGKPVPDLPPIPFQMYPRRHYLDMQQQAARDVFPHRTLAAALYEIGRRVYPTFSDTMVGKAIFSVAGRDYTKMLRLAPRGYSVANVHGEVAVLTVRPGFVEAEFTEVYDHPPFTCGIWAGAMEVCGIDDARMSVDDRAPGHMALRIEW